MPPARDLFCPAFGVEVRHIRPERRFADPGLRKPLPEGSRRFRGNQRYERVRERRLHAVRSQQKHGQQHGVVPRAPGAARKAAPQHHAEHAREAEAHQRHIERAHGGADIRGRRALRRAAEHAGDLLQQRAPRGGGEHKRKRRERDQAHGRAVFPARGSREEQRKHEARRQKPPRGAPAVRAAHTP